MSDEERRPARQRVFYVTRLIAILLRDPLEGLDRIRARLEVATDRRAAPPSYEPSQDWERRYHKALGLTWPCDEREGLRQMWGELETSLSARGLPAAGIGHDADTNLAGVVWCLTRHLRPEKAVETGVARGVTSAFILEAMERSGQGHLWSIDLPLVGPVWHLQSGVAVPDHLRRRWTFIRGASRRRLPKLLASLGQIDLFIHDSLHTHPTMSFELELAWDRLRPGGALIADDVEGNAAFAEFGSSRAGADWFVARHDGKPGLFGIAVKKA